MTRKGKQANELQINRIFQAPIEKVWSAWTNPEEVAKWWRPRGFTLTHHSRDLRPGGSWRYTMHGPDGVDYPNVTTYHEVEVHKKLVYDHGATDTTPPLFRVVVVFKDLGSTAEMEMTMSLQSPEVAEQIQKFIKQVGGDSTWDRLAEYVDPRAADGAVFSISRSFKCSQGVMFGMWMDPIHLSKWMPPKGFTMKVHRSAKGLEGSSFFEMTDGGSISFYGRIRYLEIAEPTRLVYEQEFCDAEERPSKHPGAPIWPPKMVTTVDIADESAGFTRVTLTWQPSKESSAEEIAAFIEAKSGMAVGWTGSFDKLEEELY